MYVWKRLRVWNVTKTAESSVFVKDSSNDFKRCQWSDNRRCHCFLQVILIINGKNTSKKMVSLNITRNFVIKRLNTIMASLMEVLKLLLTLALSLNTHCLWYWSDPSRLAPKQRFCNFFSVNHCSILASKTRGSRDDEFVRSGSVCA